jgi:hypothetical protein
MLGNQTPELQQMLIKQLSWVPGQGWDVVTPSDYDDESADVVLYFFGPGLKDLPTRLAELG